MMEYLEVNFDWLEGWLKELGVDAYVFDLPGQVELSTNHEKVVKRQTKNAFRVCLNILSHFSELYLCLSFQLIIGPPSWLVV